METSHTTQVLPTYPLMDAKPYRKKSFVNVCDGKFVTENESTINIDKFKYL